MPLWLYSDSAYYLITLALLALGGLLLLWGWVGHRARGVPRCRRCCYSLAGSPTLACPECGRTHRNERDATRPRRYWKRCALGLFMSLLASYALFWPDIAQRRNELHEPWFIAVVPTTAWIALLPTLDAVHIEIIDARLCGEDADLVWLPSGVIFSDDDGGQFAVDHTRYRPLVEIDRIPLWQCRLLARRCIDILNEPLPSKAEIDSKEEPTSDRIWKLDWQRMHAIYYLAAVHRHHDDAMPLLLRMVAERRHIGNDRDIAIHMLSSAGETTPELIELLARSATESPLRTIQSLTVERFTRWRESDPRVIAALKPLLNTNDSDLREPVLEALGNLRPVTPELIAVLREELLRRAGESDPESIAAMARLGAPAIPALLHDLRTLPDPEVVEHRNYLVPARVLHEMGALALPAIFELLDSPDEQTRKRALQVMDYNTKLNRDALPLLRGRLKIAKDAEEIETLNKLIAEVESR